MSFEAAATRVAWDWWDRVQNVNILDKTIIIAWTKLPLEIRQEKSPIVFKRQIIERLYEFAGYDTLPLSGKNQCRTLKISL
jgi:hypothetical protein